MELMNNKVTITSNEIAVLTNKEHYNVTRDIREIVENISVEEMNSNMKASPKTRLELAQEQVIMIAEIERLESRGNLMMTQREDSSFLALGSLTNTHNDLRDELDEVIVEHQLYTVSELLEGTGISAIKGNKILNNLGIIYKKDKSWDFKSGMEKYGETFENKKFTIIKYYSHMNLLDLILKNI